jgi:TolA-binding protein
MKKTMVVLVACIFLAGGGQAAEPDKDAATLWEKIRGKIEQITPKQKPTVTTAVGGVRGAKTDGNELYWKGEEEPAAVGAEELELFSAALGQAESGADREAATSFEDFLAKYPSSSLAEDAQSALVELAKEKLAPQTPQDFKTPELPGFKLGM